MKRRRSNKLRDFTHLSEPLVAPATNRYLPLNRMTNRYYILHTCIHLLFKCILSMFVICLSWEKNGHCSYKKCVFIHVLQSRFPPQELCSPQFLCCWINSEEHRGSFCRSWRISPSYPQRHEPLARAPCCHSPTNRGAVTCKANPGNQSARMAQDLIRDKTYKEILSVSRQLRLDLKTHQAAYGQQKLLTVWHPLRMGYVQTAFYFSNKTGWSPVL